MISDRLCAQIKIYKNNIINLLQSNLLKDMEKKFELSKNLNNPKTKHTKLGLGTNEKVWDINDFELKRFKLTTFDCITMNY